MPPWQNDQVNQDAQPGVPQNTEFKGVSGSTPCSFSAIKTSLEQLVLKLDTNHLSLRKVLTEFERAVEKELMQLPFPRQTYCKTDDEYFQVVNQNDCCRDQNFVLAPNTHQLDETIERESTGRLSSENQRSCFHEDLGQKFADCCQENETLQDQNVYQKRGDQMELKQMCVEGQSHLTHIGLIDVSHFPNPHNEKTKIALVDGYLRRVPLSYLGPVSSSRHDQTDMH